MYRKACPALLAVVSLALLIPLAPAAVVYEQLPQLQAPGPNGPAGALGAFSSQAQRVADSFLLDADATIRDVHWWGGHTSQSSGLDAFTFTFYDDLNGVPGTPLLTTGGSLVVMPEPNLTAEVNQPIEVYSSDVNTPFDAAAGVTYWLSIYNDEPNAAWYWTKSTVGTLAVTTVPPGDQWFSNPAFNLAFQLTDDGALIPEPITIALTSSALAGLAAYGRRKSTANAP